MSRRFNQTKIRKEKKKNHNYILDERRPLEIDLQESISNRPKAALLKRQGGERLGKSLGKRSWQVRCKETSASEPLMTCRNMHRRYQNQGGPGILGQVWQEPVYGPYGIRHKGGVTLH